MNFLANLFKWFTKTANPVATPVASPTGRESAAPPAGRARDSKIVTCQPPATTKNAKRETTNGPTNGRRGDHRSKCTVCKHPERSHIDQALMNGATLESLAAAHGLNLTSLYRHKHYLKVRLIKAGKALDETQQLDRLLCLARNLHRLEVSMAAAAEAGDDKAMCRLNREMHRNLKAMDKIEFRFRSLNEAILFQTLNSPDWADQPTALPTDPAILAAYRRLLVQGLNESCPLPEPEEAEAPSPVPSRHPKIQAPPPVHLEQAPSAGPSDAPVPHFPALDPALAAPPLVHVAPPPPAVQNLAAALPAGKAKKLSPRQFRRQSQALLSRVNQTNTSFTSRTSNPDPETMDPEVGFEFNSELGTSNPELDFELDFELNPELGTSNSELNFELRKTTGKQPENFPLPKALSLHLAYIALSQLADKTNILLQPYNLAEPEKSYLPQAENSPAGPPVGPPATPQEAAVSICNPWILKDPERGIWQCRITPPENQCEPSSP